MFQDTSLSDCFFSHTMALHMNPTQICFESAQMNVKKQKVLIIWLTDVYLWQSAKNFLNVDGCVRLHVHIMMMNECGGGGRTS